MRLLHKTRYVTVPAVVVAGVAGLAMLINVSPIGRYVFRAVTDSSAQGNSSVLFVIFSNLLYIAGVLLLIALALYVFIDYRQHRKPLKVAVADARYGVVHHVRKVLLPIVRRKWKVITYALTLGIASFAVIGLTFIIGIQRFAQAKNFDITIAGSGANGFVAFTPRPTLRGTAAPNSVLSVSIDNQVVGTTNASSKGRWSYEPTSDLSTGDHTLKVESFESSKYVYMAGDNGLDVISLDQQRVSGTIKLPASVNATVRSSTNDAIAVQPIAKRVYAISAPGSSSYAPSTYSTGYLSIVDTETGEVQSTLALPFRPGSVFASTDGQRVVVVGATFTTNGNLQSTSIATVDVSTDQLVGPITVIPDILSATLFNWAGVFSGDNSKYLIRTDSKLTIVSMSDGTSSEDEKKSDKKDV